MDVLEHLEHEHREVERLLEELADIEEGPEREQLVLDLDDALRLHMAVEERYVYPVVADVLDDEHVSEAHNEHDLARDGVTKLRELVAEPGFGAAVEMLQGGIAHHVREEEDEVFPALRERAPERIAGMDPDDLEERADPVDDHGGGRGGDGASAGAGDGGGDVAGLTRDELYQRAREADVPGRSRMTKDELAAALGG